MHMQQLRAPSLRVRLILCSLRLSGWETTAAVSLNNTVLAQRQLVSDKSGEFAGQTGRKRVGYSLLRPSIYSSAGGSAYKPPKTRLTQRPPAMSRGGILLCARPELPAVSFPFASPGLMFSHISRSHYKASSPRHTLSAYLHLRSTWPRNSTLLPQAPPTSPPLSTLPRARSTTPNRMARPFPFSLRPSRFAASSSKTAFG